MVRRVMKKLLLRSVQPNTMLTALITLCTRRSSQQIGKVCFETLSSLRDYRLSIGTFSRCECRPSRARQIVVGVGAREQFHRHFD